MLLTTNEVADLLKTTPGAARNVLDRLKVQPVNLGRGRGLGLRWYKSEVMEALEGTRKPKRKRKTAAPKGSLFAGKSANDLVAELTSKPSQQ